MEILTKQVLRVENGVYSSGQIAYEETGFGKSIAATLVAIGKFMYDEKQNVFYPCIDVVTITMVTRLFDFVIKEIKFIRLVNGATDLCSPFQRIDEGELKKQLRGPMTANQIEGYLDRFVAAIFFMWDRM
jgi:hypothetical protein